MRIALTALSFFVVFALTLIGAPKNFGSEAIPLAHWRNAPLTGIEYLEEPEVADETAAEDGDEAAATIEQAVLRMPEGPPLPPPDLGIETLCHTLASAAQANGLPTGFFARLIWQESKFQQRIVSHAGAQGVAQFMPAVAAARGLDNPFDPLAALPHSARFLKEHVKFFGNLGLAAAAYNAGAGRVMNWLARRGKLPEETRNYVKIITGHPAETWIKADEIALATELPQRAPCDGVADLSRSAGPTKVAVLLEGPAARLVEAARAAEAKKIADRNAKRQRLLAKGKGGKDKAPKEEIRVAGKVASKRKTLAAHSKTRTVAESSASKKKKKR